VLPEASNTVEEFEEYLHRCYEALLSKDRQGYLGGFIHGLIHNINGPLQNMSMLAELIAAGQDRADQFVSVHLPGHLEDWRQTQGKQKQRLQQLSDQISKVAEMLRDMVFLLELERTEGELDVNLTVARLVPVLRADLFFKHQVAVELRLAPKLPLTNLPGGHLIASLVQLFRNAMLAMHESATKRLIIETRAEEGGVWLTLRDSGCGFTAEQAGRLFEPFYSGWPADVDRQDKYEKRHGLGLFMVRTALQPYGVEITLSREGQETVACLKIPAASGKE
jgi:signal transduction histidine kinase